MNIADVVEDVLTQAQYESERTDFPEGFPDPIDVDARRYTDPNFTKLEKEYVLDKTWQFVGHEAQVKNVGDYRLLEWLEEPIFIVRAEDNKVRAFYNTCKHRGAKIVIEPEGNKRRLVCPLHGWAYSHEGELLGLPESKNFPRNILNSEEKKCLNLKEVRLETYGPLLFINISGDAEPLREAMGVGADELDHLLGDLSDDCHLIDETILPMQSNWKIVGDVNIETYHVNTAHRTTGAPLLDVSTTAQWLLPKGNSRMMVCFNDKTQHGIDKNAENPLIPLAKGLEVNPLPAKGIYSFHFFPNFSIVLAGPQIWYLITAVPKGAHESNCLVQQVSACPRGIGHDELLDKLCAFNFNLLNEDFAQEPGMQSGMRDGGLTKLKLQYQERRIRKLHEDIDKWIGPERVPEELRTESLLHDYVVEV